jgi:anti-sigma regulatory factor (Ser/Thr protein kinase)
MALRAVGWARSFPVAGGVRAGRQWAREHLACLDWTAEAAETVDAVLLTVSELVTNAHVHAHSTAEVVMSWDGRCLHLSVSDAGGGLPTARAQDLAATGGRGLALVDALADEWETHPRAAGKSVSACFFPPGRSDPHVPAR